MVICLSYGFCIFIHLDIIHGLAYYHSVVIVGGGLLILNLLYELDKYKISNKILDRIR
jgi:hypothetical protein